MVGPGETIGDIGVAPSTILTPDIGRRRFSWGLRVPLGKDHEDASAIPISSAFSFARWGVTAFWDSGATYDHGTSLFDVKFQNGVGAGLFFIMPLIRLNLDVANNLEGDTRVHFGLGFRF